MNAVQSSQQKILCSGMNSKLDNICFGFKDGFAIYSVDPFNVFREILRKRLAKKSLTIVVMTHNADIIGLVGSGARKTFPNNKLVMWSVSKDKSIGELLVPHPIINVIFSRKKIAVVTIECVYVYNTSNLALTGEMITINNKRGLSAMTTHKTANILAVPHFYVGSVRVVITEGETSHDVVIPAAHSDDLSQLALSNNGAILATCSQCDPCIRLWDTRTGECVRRLRKHMHTKHAVTALCFNKNSTVLACVYGLACAIDVYVVQDSEQLHHPSVEINCTTDMGLLRLYNNIFCGLIASEDDFADRSISRIRGLSCVVPIASYKPAVLSTTCTFINRNGVELLVVFSPDSTVSEYNFRSGDLAQQVSVKPYVLSAECPASAADPPDQEELEEALERAAHGSPSPRYAQPHNTADGRLPAAEATTGHFVAPPSALAAHEARNTPGTPSRTSVSRSSSKGSFDGLQIFKLLLVGDAGVGKTRFA